MFGFGKLYALINDGLEVAHVDNVFFHQCPDISRYSKDGDFFSTVWEIVFRSGVRKGWFDSTTQFFTIGKDETPFYCLSHALIDHSVGYSLGQNDLITVNAWRADLLPYFNRNNNKNPSFQIA